VKTKPRARPADKARTGEALAATYLLMGNIPERQLVNAPGPMVASAGMAADAGSDEADLLRRVASGDDAGLAELYQLHGQVVFAQILSVVGDRALAEEVLQDTMLAVWRQAATFRGESRVRSWVIAIARRQARDRLRRHRFEVVEDKGLADWPSLDPEPDLVVLDRSDVADVAAAIQGLGRSHREVLELALAAQLTLVEVAEILEIPIGTVKSRLAAARTALCRALNKERGDR
jgi:RNA polymerase sigma-70 factor, ECF subfamily